MAAEAEQRAQGPGGDRFRWVWAVGLLVVAISRALAVFDGPWEADEALFALGVLDFHVPGHRPHPPGFPGFVLTGRVVWWLVGDPLLALRIVSIVASLGGLVLLDDLLRRLVRREIAAVTTLAFAFVPGVWAHSARAFTTTVALAALLAALWTGVRAIEAEKPTVGPLPWLWVGYALCVRPQLVVVVACLAIVVVIERARRAGWRTALAFAAWSLPAAAIVIAVYVGVALDSGGFDAYLASLRAHVGRHSAAMGNGLPALERLCLVRVCGGRVGFFVITTLAGVGLGRAFVDCRGFAFAATLSVGVITASMLWAHHPAFPRYSVLWVAALVPLVALALDGVPRPWGEPLALGLTAVAIGWTWPAIQTMRTRPMPAVAALDLAVERGASHIVHSPGSSPFARLVAEHPRMDAVEPLQLRALGERWPARALAIDAHILQGDSRVLDGATVGRRAFEITDPMTRRLGQDRYDRASLTWQGVVLGDDVYQTEHTPSGQRFVWLSERATLHPPVPAALEDHQLRLDVLVVGDRSPQRVDARCEDRPLGSWTLDAGPHTLTMALPTCVDPSSVTLTLPDAVARGRDPRSLSLRLVRAWVEGPSIRVEDGEWSLGDERALAAAGVVHEGLYNPESFGDRRGRWMSGHATLSIPAEPGFVDVTLARPAFLEEAGESAPFVVETDADRRVGTLDDQPMTVRLRTEAPAGRVTVRLSGPTFVPADRRAQSADRRELAAIVYTLARARGLP